MSIMEGWETPNFEFFDMNNPAESCKVKVATDETKMEYPYVINLRNQSVFYQTVITEIPAIGRFISIWEMRKDLVDWLIGREYYQPANCAVLMFKHKNDIMQFILRWR